jgi:cytidylate kinase
MERHHLIITISRQYGSGGREIGQLLARRLSIPCYDKELIRLASEKSGFAPAHFEAPDQQEASSSLIFALTRAGAMMNSYDLPLSDKIYLAQSQTIRQLAEEGPCVLVGRCAGYVLEGHPRCVRVFLHAPLPLRVERGIRSYGLPPEKAEEIVTKTDRRRAAYSNYYTGARFGDASLYHVSLDSLSIGLEQAAGILESYVRNF